MNKKKFLKPMIVSLFVLVLIGGAITWRLATARAEQSGSSPESGVTSYIKTLYTDLTTLTYGTDTDTPMGRILEPDQDSRQVDTIRQRGDW